MRNIDGNTCNYFNIFDEEARKITWDKFVILNHVVEYYQKNNKFFFDDTGNELFGKYELKMMDLLGERGSRLTKKDLQGGIYTVLLMLWNGCKREYHRMLSMMIVEINDGDYKLEQ